jgi:hypothetical protein
MRSLGIAVDPGEAGPRRFATCSCERGIGPPIVASKQVGEPGRFVCDTPPLSAQTGCGGRQGAAAPATPAPRWCTRRAGAPYTQWCSENASRRTLRFGGGWCGDGSGGPSRVHQVPAAVIVACARADREPSRQIKRPPNHCRTCVVRLQYGLEPAVARDAIGIEEDQRIPFAAAAPWLRAAAGLPPPPAASSTLAPAARAAARRGVGRAIVHDDHLELAVRGTLRPGLRE